ncbi:predicted protein [Phaeodactylum tricornutum CCAP 1055/1]|jgi:Co/Zn/Cd efflux system component|uniref:Cation efflux protein transmembrane domain-containing protein n=3 Tax=Phaeodactylum tricornutum TaxID=2850 RepID=B7G9C9_PHATC|nr:predicted protein [Phaeodactylum tricornutum CCAP 1055/1]EEC44934.1 predicted protein [Phaeodactylum tricornutum CCAP 1055/1]|eukprot:XP_002183752.1 predicted protein [Phaeodactylum tricornutum CCAP 1055/1]
MVLEVHTKDDQQQDETSAERKSEAVTNEYVLNVAFLSFLGFTTLQCFFAVMARSQSMMADCAAMYVDVVTYLFNFLAERLKHGHIDTPWRDMRLRRLFLELIPPLISVTTLVAVTVIALRQAFVILLTPDDDESKEQQPDLVIMLVFSALNLVLDIINVSCFARADQAVGLPGQHGYEHVDGRHHDHQHCEHNANGNSTATPFSSEATPLVASNHSSNCDHEDSSQDTEAEGLNLNMCSAWTHVCADTLRSVAVLIAAGFAYIFPQLLTPADADSWGAIVVSIIILISLGPLLQGLYLTACKIRTVWCEEEPGSKILILNV